MLIRRFIAYRIFIALSLSLLAAPVATRAQQGQELPREWVDKDTGHRVVRLSDEPGSQSLYFHQNGYTPDGRKMIMTTPTGLSAVDLKTRKVEKIVEGRVGILIVGKKSGEVYYVRNRNTVLATNLDTKRTREVVKLPPGVSVSTVNADETLLAGTLDEQVARAIAEGRGPVGQRPGTPPQQQGERRGGDEYPGKGQMMENRLAERRPLQLVTVDTRTGEVKTLLRGTDWYNHIQFSPADPNLLMYCHEGPWHKVDRTWVIRTDGSAPTKVHPRTMLMEIGGHEWFSADGKWVWYDLQTPRSQVFWVAGYNVSTGERVWYLLQRPEWSVHYNSSPDGKLFAGDGGGPNSVAAPDNGQWIYLFRPEMVPDRGTLQGANGLVRPGVFKAERLVNLSRHDYSLEPNVTFTPDMKWIVFRSNMFGPVHTFAVELEKSKR
ncbi:MAG TPA: oligogalacturonate lyase family protein [Pyrinomonadaceae bacterium]|nr:oligogalacturonate lyase family protein [Pyrinomonadaceae bacterium]